MAEKVVSVFFALVIAFVLWILAATVFAGIVEAHCAKMGWREGRVTFGFTGYCATRDEQTDLVVPWREAVKR